MTFLNPIRTLFVSLFLFSIGAQAQLNVSPDTLWQEADEAELAARRAEPGIRPEGARVFALDEALLDAILDVTQPEFSAAARIAPQEITVPMPDGTYSRFEIEESLVMHPTLAAQFPEIRTYIGRGIDDPSASARFDYTPKGFHAQILKPSGAVYIDPVEKNATRLYSSYAVKDYRYPDQKAWTCMVQGAGVPSGVSFSQLGGGGVSSGTQLRTYRLAVACTHEYAAFHGGTVPLAQAAIVTMVNRVTGIYETELSIRLELVANNSLVVFVTAGSDPFTDNNDAEALINEVSGVINGAIGSANYDIGHVVSTGAGGLAGLGVVCGSRKAEGVTGRSSPINDPFWVDFVAHEIGHQFDGDHTFNGDSGSCSGGNRNGSTAYEPGSGTTIQAYAGICGNDDLQNNSDPFFHSESIDQMISFVDNTIPSCGTRVATGNSVPTVSAGADFTIPSMTPFELTAVGNDANGGDVLTYSWEQRDLGVQQDVNAGDNGSSPLFRFWTPTTHPTRTFPRLSDLLINTTVIGETLPTTTRAMNFRCVVRDNRAGGGGVSSDNMVVSVVNLGAPFQVTFPNTAVTLSGNQTVTWNVAGTTGGGVNTPNVNILLSTDGGLTYAATLAANVPNNGSRSVTLPNIDNSTARIKVQGAGNIFFDISNVNFTVEPASGLVVAPLGGLVSSGLEGGPFSPTCITYTLENDSGAVLNWQAGADEPWATVTPAGGSIPVSGSVQVDLCIGAAADVLADDDYSSTVVFTNLSNSATQLRAADLTVLPAGGLLQFSSATYNVGEGDGFATLSVDRVGDTTGAVGVSYSTANGTALQGSDYVATSSTLSWGNGDSGTKTFNIIIVDDLLLETPETILLNISSPTGGAELGGLVDAVLEIADDDSNDSCASSRFIAGAPFTATQSTAAATSTGDPTPSCSANSGNGVWYHYTAATSGTFTIDTEGSSYDTVLTAFTGGCGSSLSEVDCDDDGGDGLTSLLSLSVTPGTTYRFLAGGYNSGVGTLVVNASFVAGSGGGGNNDLCADAIVVSATPFLNTQSTTTATSTGDPEPDCSINGGSGVWYRFIAPRDGFLLVDLDGSDFDTALGIYVGSCGALTQIDCNEDDLGVLTSITETFIASGTTVYILCAGYEGDTGNLSTFVNFFGCDDDIVDGTFEGGSPWPAWSQFSTVYGSPLEDSGTISTATPLSGNSWAWFAGPNTNFTETATLAQTMILPVGAEVTLRYQLWIGFVETPFTDTFEVRVDGVTQQTITEPGSADFFYSPETVDLTAFADGNAHTIEFRYVSPAFGGFADWNVDDVQLKVCLPDFDGDGIPDDADPDDDNDDIPDVWEDANGLNSMDPTDAGIDGDGDGASGLEEYVADTSPINTLSVLKLRIEPRAPGSDEQPLSFDGSTMRDYYIQYRPSLTTGDWLPGPTNILGAGGLQSVVVTNPAPTLNYRIGVNLP